MQNVMYWAGAALAGLAGLLGIVSTNMSSGGVPANVHPMAAVAVGVAAIALIYASVVRPTEAARSLAVGEITSGARTRWFIAALHL